MKKFDLRTPIIYVLTFIIIILLIVMKKMDDDKKEQVLEEKMAVVEKKRKGKAEPAYYMQAADDFYMIGGTNPLKLTKSIPLLSGAGPFRMRVATRSAYYEVQAELKIQEMPRSRYSIMPGTKKINPFKQFK